MSAASVIVAPAIATLGMLYRVEKRFWIVEPDAVSMILVISGALLLIYWSG